jgi:hypothetical protein
MQPCPCPRLLRALDISAREVTDRHHPGQHPASHRGHDKRQVTASVKEILREDREDGNYGCQDDRVEDDGARGGLSLLRDAVGDEAKGINLFSPRDGNIGRKRRDVGFFYHDRIIIIDVMMIRREINNFGPICMYCTSYSHASFALAYHE